MRAEALTYPRTRRESLRDECGGVAFDDPYRWLEGESAEVSRWEDAQDELADAYVRSWPGYDALVASLTESIVAPVFPPQLAGGRWFRQTIDTDRMRPVIQVSTSPIGAGTVIDPIELTGAVHSIMLWWTPSPDGSMLVVGLTSGMSKPVELRFIVTDTHKVLGDRIDVRSQPLASPVAWQSDNSAIFYVDSRPGQGRWGKRALYHYRLGARAADSVLALDDIMATPQVSLDGRYVTVLQTVWSPRADQILDLAAEPPTWRPFLSDVRGRCHGLFVDDRYIAVTTEDAPNGRVVSIPVASGLDRDTWTQLRPETDGVAWSIALAGRRIVLGELVGDTTRLHLISLDGEPLGEVPVPGPGAVGLLSRTAQAPMVSCSAQEIVFMHQSHTSSAALYSYDIAAGACTQIEEPARVLEHVVSRPLTCVAPDGETVPFHAVHRRDLDLARSHPVLMTAYGGVGVADLPTYLQMFAAFVDAGGIYVHVTNRGGQEYGEDWWRGGRLENKPNNFDDFCAVGDYLVREGLTSSDQLAAYGVSNGGLMMSACLVRRPELFKAVVPLIPITDMLRYAQDDLPANWLLQEWGDPSHPEEAAFLLGYSPYHNVREGERYPATLIVCGELDDMCLPWHSRKLAARLQHANTSDAPILFRKWRGLDHIGAAAAPPALAAEWLGFLFRHIGLDPQDSE